MLEELQRRNFSPTTIRSYLYAVERFARHFKCRPDRLNHTHLRSYQAHLLRTGQLQPKTVRLHVSALRVFFVKTLRRRYLLDDTPYPKAPQRLPSILSVEEMARLIEAADGLYHRTMLWSCIRPACGVPSCCSGTSRTSTVGACSFTFDTGKVARRPGGNIW